MIGRVVVMKKESLGQRLPAVEYLDRYLISMVSSGTHPIVHHSIN